VASFFTTIVADPHASYGERMTAAVQLAKLLALYPPRRIMRAEVPASAMSEDEAAITRLRQEMLGDPVAVEACHRIYESLNGHRPSWEERMEKVTAELAALKAERDAAAGRPMNGLHELPQ
jgi:hypothetical protein